VARISLRERPIADQTGKLSCSSGARNDKPMDDVTIPRMCHEGPMSILERGSAVSGLTGSFIIPIVCATS
jgi:hypothetical protein